MYLKYYQEKINLLAMSYKILDYGSLDAGLVTKALCNISRPLFDG